MNVHELLEQQYDQSLSLNYEGMFAQGNGYIHTRATLEECFLFQEAPEEYLRKPNNVTAEKFPERSSQLGTFIPVIVGPHILLNTVSINLPGFWGLQLSWNGSPLRAEDVTCVFYQRRLTMLDGVLHRSSIWETQDGSRIELTSKRFLSKAEKHLGMLYAEIRILRGNGQLGIITGVTTQVLTNGFDHYTDRACRNIEGYDTAEVKTNGGDTIYISTRSECTGIPLEVSNYGNNREVYSEVTGNAKEGDMVVCTKSCVFSTSQDEEQYWSGSTWFDTHRALHEEVQASGYEVCSAASASVWSSEWDSAVCVVDTHEEIQQAIMFSIYHLLRSQEKHNGRITVCPKGFAGEAYFGRFFWDTDIYLLPFFLYTDPIRARDLVMFRYLTLKGAKQNASVYGCSGAKYAWESSLDGLEGCPNWQYADHEIHVTADVAYGIKQYVSATGDIEFLSSYGFEVIVETARYWLDRLDSYADGSYGYGGVMGPDEYTPFSTNNLYTNEMARYNLNMVRWAWELLGAHDHSLLQRVAARIQIDEHEVSHLSQAAKLIRGIRRKGGVLLQCDEFENLAELEVERFNGSGVNQIAAVLSQDRLYRSKVLKQADVLAYMTLFPQQFKSKDHLENLNYYEPMTSHDSSLSYSVHALSALCAEQPERAYEFFRKALFLDYDRQRRNVEHGIHIANAAGIWQVLVHGYCGIRAEFDESVLRIDPLLPEQIGSIKTRFVWRDYVFSITIATKSITVYTLSEGNQSGGTIRIHGIDYQIPVAGMSIQVEKGCL